jgi:preprotein translocase subunit SecG
MFWILLSAVLLAVVAFLYGRKGLSSVIALAGALHAKDAVGHFLGTRAEWIFVGLFAILCIAIYVTKRRNQNHDVRCKHHRESGGEDAA